MYTVDAGRPRPLGSTPDAGGVNFSIFSEHATNIELLLFEKRNDTIPIQTILLDQLKNRTFHFWHVYVRGLKPGAHYAYRIFGANQTELTGDRFNFNKVLIDPYCRGITTDLWRRSDAIGSGDNVASALRGTVIDISEYDWEGDRCPVRPMSETIIYEMHVGGFTRSASSAVSHPGTFEAMIEKIPYLQDLGITAVELMPVLAFDPGSVTRTNPLTGEPLTNYWGYDPIGHFAPHPGYCIDIEGRHHIDEFRDLVKALHKAGIEVILDVVFNHTGEGDDNEPMISFKGIDNRLYYFLDPQDKRHYLNYSGCGNTFNCNHPIVSKLITECLVFWVQEMHVDGFRFDEGSILTRGIDGKPMEYAPVLWSIELSDILADTKIIAEPWDAAGLYQVGNFPGYRWAVWNGQYRDTIRGFVKGDSGIIGAVASRIAGSQDIFAEPGQRPINGINFVTCHDGFTLNDLVSYNEKHNLTNGEDNRDGLNYNTSWNYGVEGETSDPAINALRARQIKNFFAILLLSQGVPMLLAGDEVRRTQQGNNNAYCQDNPVTWFDWRLLDSQSELLHFVKAMIAFRKAHPSIRRESFFTGSTDRSGKKDIEWHGCRLFDPGWNDPNSRVLAFTIWSGEADTDLHIMLNMDFAELDFEIPHPGKARNWKKVIDTAQPAPSDIQSLEQAPLITDTHIQLQPHSVVVLTSAPDVS
ncbi:glycogen debranching enzyme [Dictyobacter alpinus]|uniref:Glycogen debranching enzyme n=1 Tax=Dictyobacter alpinus TaxID=2014873 RepID=A0A402BBG7_9CHLR|nr:glycogen debranching protein GlgX [Dictyobacter alpinus]GCE28617.1 glycogen debranching enzyme [Dictyobacter alpinus]